VDRVVPVAKGSGLIVADGEAIVPRGPSMLSSWIPAPVGAFTVRDGQPPSQSDEVVLDVATATAHNLGIGDTVTVQAERNSKLRIVGLAGFGDEDGIANATVALVATETAQRLLDLGTGVSEVAVTTTDDTTTTALRDRLTAALGDEFEVGQSRDTAAAAAAAAKTQLEYVEVMLLILAGAALLIGGF
jgi:putative ABC transport system permease protein